MLGVSDQNGVSLETEWNKICRESKFGRIVPSYHKIDILGSEAFLQDKFKLLGGNDCSEEDTWKKFKNKIFEVIKRYVTQKGLSKNWEIIYYIKEPKRLK